MTDTRIARMVVLSASEKCYELLYQERVHYILFFRKLVCLCREEQPLQQVLASLPHFLAKNVILSSSL